MFFHVILTDQCNLCCRYCRGKEFESLLALTEFPSIDCELPGELSYDLEDLYRFLRNDPEACITFYGGEPLMRIDLIREIMDNAPVGRFMLQTNGIRLHELGKAYVNRLETILVSIDGPEEITDRNRGEGTFSRVIANILKTKQEGFEGEIIARMTVTEGDDVYQAVRFLDSNPLYCFSSIHWQIDADFSRNSDIAKFSSWLAETYVKDVRKLISEWVAGMERYGKVPKWYPFLQTTEDLFLKKTAGLRCGCGYANYTINTDGTIGPCPVMIGMKDFYIGDIFTSDPTKLPEVRLTGICTNCDILDFCGGRCLYADIVKPWTEEQKGIFCGSVRALNDGITEVLPEISNLIRKKTIGMEDFAHTRFNGCEIIP
jgi:uncharacterized protein